LFWCSAFAEGTAMIVLCSALNYQLKHRSSREAAQPHYDGARVSPPSPQSSYPARVLRAKWVCGGCSSRDLYGIVACRVLSPAVLLECRGFAKVANFSVQMGCWAVGPVWCFLAAASMC
jgi:hypothetical protein